MSGLRKITPLDLPHRDAAELVDRKPMLQWVKPTELYVDETYQRDLSRKSLSLIKKLAKEFDWSHFKPPIVVQAGREQHIIDGQHTAIAAATVGVPTIPIFVVHAEA